MNIVLPNFLQLTQINPLLSEFPHHLISNLLLPLLSEGVFRFGYVGVFSSKNQIAIIASIIRFLTDSEGTDINPFWGSLARKQGLKPSPDPTRKLSVGPVQPVPSLIKLVLTGRTHSWGCGMITGGTGNLLCGD